MTKPKLTYFDAPISRGEECRLALFIAGVDFEDVRLNPSDWPALKPNTPFGGLPTLEVPGRPILAQSLAILVFIGREYGLHPQDAFEAARHEAMMCHVEELRGVVMPTVRMKDEAEKKKAREALVASYLPTWAERTERQIGDGPFFGGDKLNVVDLKLYMAMHWFIEGKVDHIPATIFAEFPKFNRVHNAVRAHERFKAWYARN